MENDSDEMSAREALLCIQAALWTRGIVPEHTSDVVRSVVTLVRQTSELAESRALVEQAHLALDQVAEVLGTTGGDRTLAAACRRALDAAKHIASQFSKLKVEQAEAWHVLGARSDDTIRSAVLRLVARYEAAERDRAKAEVARASAENARIKAESDLKAALSELDRQTAAMHALREVVL